MIAGAVRVWGAAVTQLGPSLALALALLSVAGWADVVSPVLRTAMVMSSVPEHRRGRMSSFQMTAVRGAPRSGELEPGAVAAAVGTEISEVPGGPACIADAVLLAASAPGFHRHGAGVP